MKIIVSLRGTLAEDYVRVIMGNRDSQRSLDNYLSHLLTFDDPTLLKLTKNGITLIGKKSERGQFLPDW